MPGGNTTVRVATLLVALAVTVGDDDLIISCVAADDIADRQRGICRAADMRAVRQISAIERPTDIRVSPNHWRQR